MSRHCFLIVLGSLCLLLVERLSQLLTVRLLEHSLLLRQLFSHLGAHGGLQTGFSLFSNLIESRSLLVESGSGFSFDLSHFFLNSFLGDL